MALWLQNTCNKHAKVDEFDDGASGNHKQAVCFQGLSRESRRVTKPRKSSPCNTCAPHCDSTRGFGDDRIICYRRLIQQHPVFSKHGGLSTGLRVCILAGIFRFRPCRLPASHDARTPDPTSSSDGATSSTSLMDRFSLPGEPTIDHKGPDECGTTDIDGRRGCLGGKTVWRGGLPAAADKRHEGPELGEETVRALQGEIFGLHWQSLWGTIRMKEQSVMGKQLTRSLRQSMAVG